MVDVAMAGGANVVHLGEVLAAELTRSVQTCRLGSR